MDSEKSRRRQIHFEVDESLADLIERAASDEGLSTAAFCRRLALLAARRQPVAA
jgi:uncharacterized protein (DUF1778 family)